MKNKKSWQKKAIFSNLEKIAFWSLYWFILIVVFIIIEHFFNWKFMWEEISPFEVPSLIPRLFLSALSYVWPWALLYKYKVYQMFYRSLSRRTFIEVKSWIWIIFSAIIYIFIESFIWFLNYCASFVFNTYVFFISIFPVIWISLLFTMLFTMLYVRWKVDHENIIHSK